MNQYPSINVVTVVLNAEEYISDTIQSVINQTYNNISYTIIDGKSNDNTINIINNNIDYISSFISEKDDGIYDAMNKAINLSTADWLIFMNAGEPTSAAKYN